MSATLNDICNGSKHEFDLTSSADQSYLYDVVDRLKPSTAEEVLRICEPKLDQEGIGPVF